MGRHPFAPGRPPRADVVVAAVFTAATVLALLADTVTRGSAAWTPSGTWWSISALVVAVTLAWRRRRPLVPVGVVLVAVYLTYGETQQAPVAIVVILSWCMAWASAALHGSWWTLLGVVLASAAVVTAADVLLDDPFEGADLLLFAIPAAVGGTVRWARLRRRRRELALRRRDWEDERRAVEQERVRMARELHDVVAHHVSGIVVSGGAALRILDRDPDAVRETLRTIAESAGRTTDAMHRMITNGEDGADVGRDGGPGRAQPGLAELHDLVERFTRTGCSVGLHTTGDLHAVAPAAGLSVYRIVQECLTNSLKHAGPVAVTVRVDRGPDDLLVRVDDAGRAADVPLAPLHGTGQGLVGMAERVAIFGGSLDFGPRLGGGWSVRASLPLGRPAAG